LRRNQDSARGCPFFFFFDSGDFPRRRGFARLSRADQIGSGRLARTTVEFDTVDSEAGEAVAARRVAKRAGPRRAFGLARAMTTAGRFEDEFGSPPLVGIWYELTFSPDASGARIPCWFAELTATGYTSLSRGYITAAVRLISEDDPEPPPRSLGAAAAPRRQLPSELAAACNVSNLGGGQAAERLNNLPAGSAIRVRDVGQANFVTLELGGKPLLHFDVGTPTAFNKRSAPLTLPSVPERARTPVVLTHWDWDHLHGALQIPSLRRGPWIVPDQPLGPGAARLAHQLARKGLLNVWHGGAQGFGFGTVAPCSGPGGRNDNGLALIVSLLNGRRIAVVGDAAYSALSAPFHNGAFDGLVATHHGARLRSGDIPLAPSVGSPAYVVSYGVGNVYGHPHPEALRAYKVGEWGEPRFTAGRGRTRRGDRYA